MKKICFIVSSPLTAHSFLRGPINKLSQDYEVYLILNEKNKYKKLIKNLNVKKVFHFEILRKISVFKDISCLIKMIYFLKKNKFDAIHSVSPKAGLISMLAGRFALIPQRVHTFTGQVWANKKGAFRFLLKSIDRLIARCATQVLVDGKSQLRYLKENGVIGPAQVLGKGSVCGVSLIRFAPSANLRKERRKILKLEENEWAFMFLGRLNKDKGVIDLIKAFAQLDQSKKNSSLFLVGHDEEQIKTRFQHISSKIRFIPFEKKPEELLQACDSFCLPSYREGFGLSVVEASAIEKPVICSDAYGLDDTIIQGKTGLRHRVGDVEHLKEQLSFALNHPKELHVMGKAGRKYVEANFSEKHLLEEWENFYKNSFLTNDK